MSFGVNYENESTSLLHDLQEWYSTLTQWIPPANLWVMELVLGKLPEDDYEIVYRFAQDWGKFAELFGDFLEATGKDGAVVTGNWSGDATAANFVNHWMDISTAASEMQQH